MNKKAFSTVMLTARKHRSPLAETIQDTANCLKQAGFNAVLEEETSRLFKDLNIPTIANDVIAKQVDIICVIGGDGSLLTAAKIAIEYDLPIIGINRGRLGFLTDIPPHNLDLLIDTLRGNFILEERFLLNTHVESKEQKIFEASALNDIVLQQGDQAQMIEFDTTIDDIMVCNQRADGLIIATPTGSTAYALSGGGPILHPSLDVVTLVPMFPHTLTSRPIVVNGKSRIQIHLGIQNEVDARFSCDGHSWVCIPPGSTIHITEKQKKLQLVRPSNCDYFATLRGKLGWSSKPA